MKYKLRINGIVALMLAMLMSAPAQEPHQVVTLRADLRSSIRLSTESIDLKLQGGEGRCAIISVPLDFAWNIDQRDSTIQIIAFFQSSGSALKSSRGEILPASSVAARIGDSLWKTFPERKATARSGLLLTTINVAEIGRQAVRHTQIDFQVCGLKWELQGKEYHGLVDLKAIIR